MTAEDGGSITRCIQALRASEEVDDAAREVWARYFDRLVGLARARLANAPKGRADEEDVALSALDDACRGMAGGLYPGLGGRDDLWRLLVTITARKASNLRRDESRAKRGGGRTVGEGALAAAGPGEAAAALDRIAGPEPTPEDAAMVVEELDRLFAMLADDTLRQIARMRLEGYQNEEIRRLLGLSTRAVERKLALIRKRWEQEEAG